MAASCRFKCGRFFLLIYRGLDAFVPEREAELFVVLRFKRENKAQDAAS